MIAKWEAVIGVEVAGWGVKQMKTRWGTCNEVYEQTGKLPISPSGVSTDAPTSLEYLIYAEHKNYGVKVLFSSQAPGSPTRIRLTRDTALDGTFYRAHELFSVRTILSILRGEIPYKQVAQLVEEACRSPEEMGGK